MTTASLSDLVAALPDHRAARALLSIAERADDPRAAELVTLLRARGDAVVADWAARAARRSRTPARRIACQILADHPGRRAVDELDQLLQTGQSSVMPAVREALIRIGDARVVTRCLAALTTTSARARATAAEVLSELRPTDIADDLARIAGDGARDSEVRTAAASVLRSIGGTEAWEAAEELARGPSAHARQAAAQIVGGQQGPEAIRVLQALAEAPERDVMLAAFDGLEASGVDVLEATVQHAASSDWVVRQSAARRLGRLPQPAPALVLIRLAGDGDVDVRGAGRSACEAQGAVDLLETARAQRTNPDARFRRGAAWLLGVLQEAQDISALAAAATDGDGDVRLEAARSLVRCDPSKAPALGLQMASDRDWEVRQWAARALANAEGAQSLDALFRLAEDKDEDVRAAAADALRHQEAPRAVAAVAMADLTTEASEIAQALIALPPEQALSMVTRRLKAGEWNMRRHCARILGALEGLDSSIGAGDILSTLTADDDEDVRAAAIVGLLDSGHPGALREAVLGLFDPHDTTRRAAAGGLDDSDLPWEAARDRLDAILEWGRKTGRSLLGDEVDIVPLRRGAAQTRYAIANQDTPVLEINPEVLFTDLSYADDVVRGLILHELGHHAFDYRKDGFKSAAGVAYASGVRPVFDVLLDERLERNLRSADPEWERCVDRMNAYLIGGGPDALSAPGAMPPMHALLMGIMGGVDRTRIADASVRTALELIPTGFKDADHAEVLRVALAIAEVLGIDDGGRAQEVQWARLRDGGGRGTRAAARAFDRMRAAGRCVPGGGEHHGHGPGGHDHHADRMRRGPKRQVVIRGGAPRRRRGRAGGPPTRVLNLSRELDFPQLNHEAAFEPDAAAHAALVATVRPQIRRLRVHFERLGRHVTEEPASRRGRRPDLGRLIDMAIVGRPDVLVHTEDRRAGRFYVGLLIDRSGSMAGAELDLAKRFAVLLAEAARGLPGVTGHVNAFDDSTFWRLGDFRRNAVAALTAGGGNNDAGALQRAAHLAMDSGRPNRLLVMISDGSPTECSVDALRGTVSALQRRHGIVCAQVAVAHLKQVAFPHFLDVTEMPTSEATSRFGRLLQRLTTHWR